MGKTFYKKIIACVCNARDNYIVSDDNAFNHKLVVDHHSNLLEQEIFYGSKKESSKEEVS